MELFHCMVRFGTVHFWGCFPLGTVPGTWYFLVPLRSRFQARRTVTKTWRVNSADHWLAGENRHYCVTELATRDSPLQLYPLDLNQHSQRRIGRRMLVFSSHRLSEHVRVVARLLKISKTLGRKCILATAKLWFWYFNFCYLATALMKAHIVEACRAVHNNILGQFNFIQHRENRLAADLKQCMPVREFVRFEPAPTPRHCHKLRL